MGTKDFNDKFKQLKLQDHDINILLLGETGVGKSTFINSLANYLTFKSFKAVEKSELLVLIPSVITVTDPRTFQPTTITIGKDSNEYQEVGASATQDVKTYVFPIGEGNTKLRLIDTPGMGDTRGVEQDDENCEHILSYLGQLTELHAICFLMKPTNTRITVLFEYCMKQILSRLDKSASKNIIFIFTNTRGTDYTPGDTMPCLEKVIREIAQRPPHVNIPSSENVFSFDNEAFKFLAAAKNGIQYDDEIKQKFMDSWKISSKECWRLITYIVGDTSREPLKPHQLQNTMSVNEARRLIVQLSQPLVEISQLIDDNLRILKKHQDNLSVGNKSLDEIKKKLYIPTLNLQTTQLTEPATVCTSVKCADILNIDKVKRWHYRQRCHDPCYLSVIEKEVIGAPGLLNCAAMNGSRSCSKCSCDFMVHMHVYFLTKTVEDKIVDNMVQNDIQHRERALLEIKRLMRNIEERKTELTEEREVITKTTAQFAHFLQHNAITPFNDSYKNYLKYLIDREKRLGPDADEEAIQNLEHLMNRYEELKLYFDKLLLQSDGATSTVTANTVITSIHHLYQLKHTGKKIHKMLKIQRAARQSEYQESCEYVHPTASSALDTKKKKKGQKSDKTTDDEKRKKKGNKGTDSEGKNKSKNPNNRPQVSQTCTFTNSSRNFNRQHEPPPPYPGQTNYQQRFFPKGKSKSDNKANVTVKVELSEPTRKNFHESRGGPFNDHRTNYNTQQPYAAPSYGQPLYGGPSCSPQYPAPAHGPGYLRPYPNYGPPPYYSPPHPGHQDYYPGGPPHPGHQDYYPGPHFQAPPQQTGPYRQYQDQSYQNQSIHFNKNEGNANRGKCQTRGGQNRSKSKQRLAKKGDKKVEESEESSSSD